MTTSIPENIVRVSLVHQMTGQAEQIVNTLHLRRRHSPGNPTNWPADVQEIAGTVRDKYVAAGRPLSLLAGACHLIAVIAYHLRAVDGANPWEKAGTALHIGRVDVDVPGGDNSSRTLPLDVGAVVTLNARQPGEVLANPKRGPSPSKQHRGRIYTGPFSINRMIDSGPDAGRFDPAFRDALATSWAAFLNDVEGAHVADSGGVGDPSPDVLETGVLSRVGGDFHRLTSIVVDDLPDTQRRRSMQQVPRKTTRAINQD